MPAPTFAGARINARLKVGLLLGAVIAAAVAIHRFNPAYWPPLAVDILHSLHGPGFAAIALLVFWYLQRRFPNSSNYLIAAGIAMGIGVISEAAQIPGPRDAQFSDLVVDGLGIFGALGMRAAFDAEVRAVLRTPLRILLPALAGCAVAIACVPTLWLSFAQVQQVRAFPQILTFEHRWETATFGQTRDARPTIVAAPAGWPVPGRKVAYARESGRWGILISIDPWPQWQDFTALSFVAASTAGAFPVDIGIRDMKKDGEYDGVAFYKSVVVGPEPQRFTVTFDEILASARERALDLALVEAIVISAADPGNGDEIFVDDFRLER